MLTVTTTMTMTMTMMMTMMMLMMMLMTMLMTTIKSTTKQPISSVTSSQPLQERPKQVQYFHLGRQDRRNFLKNRSVVKGTGKSTRNDIIHRKGLRGRSPILFHVKKPTSLVCMHVEQTKCDRVDLLQELWMEGSDVMYCTCMRDVCVCRE